MPRISRYPSRPDNIRAKAIEWISQNFFAFFFALSAELLESNKLNSILSRIKIVRSGYNTVDEEEYFSRLVLKIAKKVLTRLTQISPQRLRRFEIKKLRTTDYKLFISINPLPENPGLTVILSEGGILEPLIILLAKQVVRLSLSNSLAAKLIARQATLLNPDANFNYKPEDIGIILTSTQDESMFFTKGSENGNYFACPAKKFVQIAELCFCLTITLKCEGANYQQFLRFAQDSLSIQTVAYKAQQILLKEFIRIIKAKHQEQ